ncbi:UDP-N-acetyl-D-mannosamine dehydrogenase [Luteococcus sanguinis]|uniref:UDP-N-acetyl-D-mannosamine dehydrogenase n=1 Tax=Luteococcus sanguinis TaxID=174038 RepID=A0ABW1X248_9ACTN
MALPVNSICVIGLGYIGLPTAIIFASHGVKVTGVDVSDRHVDAVNRGELPFVEEGLDVVLKEVVDKGLLTAQKETPEADVFIVAVPTPFAEGYKADVSYIEAAAKALAPKLKEGNLVVLESTSPPGTTEHMAEVILAERPDLSADGKDGKPVIHFSHAPERVLPGRIMVELAANDRVLGGMTPAATELTRDVYAIFCTGELLTTDARTAEMAKLTENSFRDVNIAFANELSVISEKMGIDVWELIELANHHPRVNILQPGPGVGGHCIAVDPWFIVSAAPQESRLIHTARVVNDDKPEWVIDHVLKAIEGNDSPTIAALGLAFKADIDDLRESPAVAITKKLAERLPAAKVLAVEPNVTELPKQLTGIANVELADLDTALEAADVVLLLVDHKEFKALDRARLEGKQVVDTRGTWR